MSRPAPKSLSLDFGVIENGSEDDAALLSGSVRQPLAKGRMRKRDPRSSLAILRRACKFRKTPPGAISGQADVDAADNSEDLAEANSAFIDSSSVPQSTSSNSFCQHTVHITSNVSTQSGNIPLEK